MKKEDIKMGMKVVPFQKTVQGYEGINSSCNWERAKEKNQLYLYVVDWDKVLNCWVLGENENGLGDFFNSCDFDLYIEKQEVNGEEYRGVKVVLDKTELNVEGEKEMKTNVEMLLKSIKKARKQKNDYSKIR